MYKLDFFFRYLQHNRPGEYSLRVVEKPPSYFTYSPVQLLCEECLLVDRRAEKSNNVDFHRSKFNLIHFNYLLTSFKFNPFTASCENAMSL
jgi:hypothetical protein